jgi:cytochrome c-type biogenesis protein CcmH
VRRVLLLALIVALAAPGVALALTVDDVSKDVRCPTCNVPLNVSNSPVANDMREYIAQRIERGWTKERIIDGLVDEFGPTVRTIPPKEGFDLIAWVVPGVLVAAGLLAIALLTRLWARRRSPPAAPTPPAGPEAERLQQELDRYGPG